MTISPTLNLLSVIILTFLQRTQVRQPPLLPLEGHASFKLKTRAPVGRSAFTQVFASKFSNEPVSLPPWPHPPDWGRHLARGAGWQEQSSVRDAGSVLTESC